MYYIGGNSGRISDVDTIIGKTSMGNVRPSTSCSRFDARLLLPCVGRVGTSGMTLALRELFLWRLLVVTDVVVDLSSSNRLGGGFLRGWLHRHGLDDFCELSFSCFF